MVQDPNFWRRFSLAVHQDDLSKETTPDLKHTYVAPPTSSSAPLSPSSQCHLSPAFASPASSMQQLPTPSPLSPPHVSPLRREQVWQSEFDAEKQLQLQRERERQLCVPAKKQKQNKLKKSASQASKRPLLRNGHTRTSSSFTSHSVYASAQHTPTTTTTIDITLQRPQSVLAQALRCPSSLSLTGRPRTMFKTWTEITANPVHSDSWLAGQKKKHKQRAWICWCFWLGVIALVAGVVVAVLVLRAHGII
jgi:hypothetical protein